MKLQRILTYLFTALLLPALLAGCEASSQTQTADTVLGSGSRVLRVLSGSENRELEPILEQFARQQGTRIEMTYLGSLDIMRQLEREDFPYDAVWPASSLWLNAGESPLNLKHTQSISITPVVFGIRQSLAEQLGFVGKEVTVQDLLGPIQSGELKFCMTSASQSNSGACAYIGFLYALLGNPEAISLEDLQGEELRTQMTQLLSGVDRSSGSSDWLKDMFLEGDFDAMVNYECLIIQANQRSVPHRRPHNCRLPPILCGPRGQPKGGVVPLPAGISPLSGGAEPNPAHRAALQLHRRGPGKP